uniref:Uncharacterized protein n=1 Tax=Arundo donax TaxID=35708 RepID=A0A0A9ASE2_ARUDO
MLNRQAGSLLSHIFLTYPYYVIYILISELLIPIYHLHHNE